MAIHCCSGYQAIHCCSGYPQGNLGIHACWRLQPIRTPRPIPGLSPNGRSSSYLQLEFRRRVVRPPLDQRPTLPPPGALQLYRLQGCDSLKIHNCHPFSEALTNQTIKGSLATLRRKPNCGCQLLVKRKPHCRHQLSRGNISGLSLTSSQKGLKNATRSNVARAEVSWCAREPGESLRYTGAPVAGWQQQPRRHQHRYIHRRALLLLPQCSTTDARARQLARKKLKLPAKAGEGGGRGLYLRRETLDILTLRCFLIWLTMIGVALISAFSFRQLLWEGRLKRCLMSSLCQHV